ncbi:hypothetical protein PoB_002016900 [Plakobranchus ocellatus]|uniref:Secreted protein n=1 Tax=Plakobranchus ocellatus TaxID=259542 RepID=A0AAV3ZH02_9GAST|nr:hypothetical protein PoB_002016900 [Plakobranchus ocellatus]
MLRCSRNVWFFSIVKAPPLLHDARSLAMSTTSPVPRWRWLRVNQVCVPVSHPNTKDDDTIAEASLQDRICWTKKR